MRSKRPRTQGQLLPVRFVSAGMYFGDEKIRQMARSILPSTWRQAPVHRALIHRRLRREVHQSLSSLLNDPELWDDGMSFGEAIQKEVRPFVNGRRGGDKLNHFQRWAVERTKQLPLGSRLGAMRSVLPDGLIGQHAISHLEHNKRISPPKFLRKPGLRLYSIFMHKGELAQLLRALLEAPDGHRAFNRTLRNVRFTGPVNRLTELVPQYRIGPRRLQSLHDVLPFIDAVEADPLMHLVVDHFLRVWKRTRNVEVAEKAASAPRRHPSF